MEAERPIVESLKLLDDFAAAVHCETDEVICKDCWEKVSDFNEDGHWLDWDEEDAREMLYGAGHRVICNRCGWIVGSKPRINLY